MICWKIRIFAYWTTPHAPSIGVCQELWFAEKFVSLLIEQHLSYVWHDRKTGCDLLKNSYLCLLNNTWRRLFYQEHQVVICWKIRIFAYWTTPKEAIGIRFSLLWFAEKFVSLLIEQHPAYGEIYIIPSCDLLKNSYLCLLNNTGAALRRFDLQVVICWKIRIFAYWTTPWKEISREEYELWFAEKFVSLLIEQHLSL